MWTAYAPSVLCRLLKYERQLATLTAMNSALQSENEELRALGESANDAEEELAELQEEFGRRLGQADKSIADLRVRGALC